MFVASTCGIRVGERSLPRGLASTGRCRALNQVTGVRGSSRNKISVISRLDIRRPLKFADSPLNRAQRENCLPNRGISGDFRVQLLADRLSTCLVYVTKYTVDRSDSMTSRRWQPPCNHCQRIGYRNSLTHQETESPREFYGEQRTYGINGIGKSGIYPWDEPGHANS